MGLYQYILINYSEEKRQECIFSVNHLVPEAPDYLVSSLLLVIVCPIFDYLKELLMLCYISVCMNLEHLSITLC